MPAKKWLSWLSNKGAVMAGSIALYAEEPVKPPTSERGLYVEQRPLDEAANFDIAGAPAIGVAYIRHPQQDRRLLPLASYHAEILVEKANEAVLMLTHLGASRIELSCSSKMCDEVKADVELMFGLVTIGGTKERHVETAVIYRAEGEGAPPRDLPALTWIKQPGWEAIIQGRLHSGLREFSTSFTYLPPSQWRGC